MHLSLEELDEVERELTITVPSKTFEQRIEKCMVESMRSANRDGHDLSLEEMRRQHGREIRRMIVGHIVEEGIAEMLKTEALTPVGEVATDIINMEPGSDLQVVITFDVLPDIKLGDLSKIILREPEVEITDEDVDQEIHEMRLQEAEYHEVRRAVREDDRVTFAFGLDVDGEMVDEKPYSTIRIAPDKHGKLGDDLRIAIYSEALMGAEIGEFRPVPAEPEADPDAGQETNILIVVKKVEEPILPAFDADLMARYFAREIDMEAAREVVQNFMWHQIESYTEEHIRQQLVDQLAAMHPIPLPDALLRSAVDEEKERLAMEDENEQHGDDADVPYDPIDEELDKEEEEWREAQLWEQAEKDAIFNLVLTTIVDVENMTPDEAWVREEVEEIARRSKNPERAIKHLMDDEDMMRGIEARALGEQAVQYLLDAATIKPVPCSFQEAVSGSYIEPDRMKAAREA